MGAEDDNAFESGLNATHLQNVGSSLFFAKGLFNCFVSSCHYTVYFSTAEPNILTKEVL